MARPTLPRLRRGRARGVAGDVDERTEPRISELSADGLTWVHAERPGALEVSFLAERFGFHELDIEDVLSKRQRPKIDEYPEYLFVVLHFPFYDKAVRRLNAAELDVFLGQDFLITLPNVELRPVSHLFRQCEADPELRSELFRGSGYLLYHVLDDLFDYCFPILDKIGAKLDAIEAGIFEERSEDVVRDISNAKQEIIAYRKIIKPERATLRMLERSTERFLPEDLDLYFDDIVDAAERVWDLLDNYKEVIEGLESTNESFISHKQQYRLQLLTVVTVILLPLTLITGLFGMNVAVPGEGEIEAFWLIVSVMACSRPGAARALPLPPLAVSARLIAQAAGGSDAASAESVRALLGSDECFWLDLEAPGEEEFALLQETFGFHPLAVEDSRHFGQRPKAEDYEDYVFLVVYGWSPDEDGLVEVHCFLSEKFLVTVRRDEAPGLEALRAQVANDGTRFRSTVPPAPRGDRRARRRLLPGAGADRRAARPDRGAHVRLAQAAAPRGHLQDEAPARPPAARDRPAARPPRQDHERRGRASGDDAGRRALLQGRLRPPRSSG